MAKRIKKSSQKILSSKNPKNESNTKEEIFRVAADFENASDTAKLGVIFMDSRLFVRHYSPTILKWFNVKPEDCGLPIARLKRRLGYDRIEEDASQVLKSHGFLEREVQTKKGISLIARIRPYYAHDKTIDGVTIAFVDISAQKQVEEMLHNMVDAAPDATLAINEDGIIILVNKQIEKVFGYKRGDLIGKPLSTIIPERFHQVHVNHRMRYLKEPKVRPMGTGLHLFGWRSDGTEFPVEISLSPLNTPDGTLAMAAIRDISERLETERKMRQLTSLLSEAEKKERQRVSQILHDNLQQQLFAIKANLQVLGETYHKKDWETLQATLLEMEGWLSEIISITRDLSQDLSPIIPPGESFADSLTRVFAEKRQLFALNVVFKTQETKITFDADLHLLLLKVVRELLFNVVKHANTLQATVSLEQTDNEVLITVSDEGQGFDQVTVMNTPDLGHGLLSIRQRLELVGCHMDVVSKSGAGTSVVIHCPSTSF